MLYDRMAERSKAADCKSVIQEFESPSYLKNGNIAPTVER